MGIFSVSRTAVVAPDEACGFAPMSEVVGAREHQEHRDSFVSSCRTTKATLDLRGARLAPDAPTLHVDALTVFGGVEIKHAKE